MSDLKAAGGDAPKVITCEDAADRPGKSTVVVRDGRLWFTTPPGETAKYTSREVSELILALQAKRTVLWRVES